MNVLLGDKPNAIAHVLIKSIQSGAKAEELAAIVAYAAALRIAQFPNSNELSDWDTALHTFTFASADLETTEPVIWRIESGRTHLRLNLVFPTIFYPSTRYHET